VFKVKPQVYLHETGSLRETNHMNSYTFLQRPRWKLGTAGFLAGMARSHYNAFLRISILAFRVQEQYPTSRGVGWG
jgi:hypothetical protein